MARAKDEFQKSSEHVNLQVLKAVFELEADASGHLGLQKQTLGTESEEEATLWNGLALAKYYKYLDRIDEDEKAYQVYSRLEPYIEKDFSKLSMHFGYEFGKRLDGLNSQRAKDWFTFVNKYISPGFSQIREIDVKIHLFSSCISCGDTDLDDLKDAIEILIEKSPSFMETSDYYWYRRICCAQSLVKWEKGSPPPEKLLALLQRYLDESKDYAEKKKDYSYQFTAIYLQLIYMNRIGDTNRARALLADLNEIMPLANENNDKRTQQGRQIQYMEQTLYFLFMLGQRTRAIAAADDLLESPIAKKISRVNLFNIFATAVLAKMNYMFLPTNMNCGAIFGTKKRFAESQSTFDKLCPISVFLAWPN